MRDKNQLAGGKAVLDKRRACAREWRCRRANDLFSTPWFGGRAVSVTGRTGKDRSFRTMPH